MPFSRKYLSAAKLVLDRDACHSARDPEFRRPQRCRTQLADDRRHTKRRRAADRPDRFGKKLDARRDHRPHQRDEGYHIVTIEDPIEFLHNHKKCTINQREVGADTKDFASALRAALRQAPKVILVGEMRDLETAEIALEAAETGHLVLSTLHTIDASKTIDRIIGLYPKNEERIIRTRLAQTFRYIVSQRLIPSADGKGRIAAVEILKSNPRTREYIEKGESEGKTLLDAIRDGEIDGMQDFDSASSGS